MMTKTERVSLNELVLHTIAAGHSRLVGIVGHVHSVAPHRYTERDVDRALQRLRKNSIIEYTNGWRRVRARESP